MHRQIVKCGQNLTEVLCTPKIFITVIVLTCRKIKIYTLPQEMEFKHCFPVKCELYFPSFQYLGYGKEK